MDTTVAGWCHIPDDSSAHCELMFAQVAEVLPDLVVTKLSIRPTITID